MSRAFVDKSASESREEAAPALKFPLPQGAKNYVTPHGAQRTHAVGGGLACRCAACLAHELGLPGCLLAKRDGEDGVMAMDDIAAKEQGNAEPSIPERASGRAAAKMLFGGCLPFTRAATKSCTRN